MVAGVSIWGVVNVTPDSFSDGGHYLDPERAVHHAQALAAAGADVIDIGAESTRPGAARVGVAEEVSRLTPVVTRLVAEGYRVSVDTMNAKTAEAMLELGVPIINDVSGGLADPDMFSVVAGSGADYVLMHWKGPSDTMDSLAHYDDVVTEVVQHLSFRVEAAVSAGLAPRSITLDPGFGFSKQPHHNWELCRGIDRVVALGFPVLAGVSRKRFIAASLADGHDMAQRDWPSAMVGAWLTQHGVTALRVHNVEAQRQALEIMAHMDRTPHG